MRARLFLLPLLVVSVLSSSLSAAITGRLVSPDGTPLKGVEVAAYAPESSEGFNARITSDKPERVPIARTVTNDAGMFLLDVKAAPSAIVATSSSQLNGWAQFAWKDDDLGTVALRSVTARTGRVTSGGKGVAGALVLLTRVNGSELQTRTDSSGAYSLPHPADWSGNVYVIEPATKIVTRRIVPKNAPLDVPVQAIVKLTGRTMTADGKAPVAGAELRVDGFVRGRSGDDGSFAIDAPRDWRQLVAMAGATVGVRTSGTAATDVRLGRGASVSLLVRDGKSQKPLAGVIVALAEGEGFMAVPQSLFVSDTKGAINAGNVPPSRGRLLLTAADYSLPSVELTIGPGEKIARTLTATPLARITGNVRDDEKKPVAGALIRPQLSRVGLPSPGSFRMIQEVSTTSAPDGTFILRNIEPETRIEIAAMKRGWPVAREGPFQLGQGERRSGVLITIPAGYPIEVKTANADGDAITGAIVDAAPSRGSEPTTFFVRGPANDYDETLPRTDDKGVARLRLVEGSYDLTVRAKGYAPLVHRSLRVNASTEPLTMTLRPAVAIAGRVVRSDGSGIADVAVSAFASALPVEPTLSAADGSFSLSGIAEGRVMLEFSKADELILENREVQAPMSDLEVRIDVGGSISGRVVEKGSKQPITDFRIGISGDRSGGGMVIRRPATMRSYHSEDGSFSIDRLPTGPTDIVVDAPGYVQATLRKLEVPTDRPLRDVEATLEPAVRITGKVTGPDGAPLLSARVGTLTEDVPFMMNAATTDSSGEYVLDGQAPGEVVLMFSKEGLASERKSVKLSGREARVDAKLSAGKTIAGIVVDESGRPISEASVSLMGTQRRPTITSTDATGAFKFEGVESGRYQLRASKSGLTPAELSDVDADTAGQLRIELKSGAVLVGRVVGLPREQLGNVFVAVRPVEGRPLSTNTDPSGAFRIEGVPAGSVRVTAATGGVASPATRYAEQKTLNVAPTGETSVELEFKDGATVTGVVTKASQPLSGVEVSFQSADRRVPSVGSSTTDARGRYEVTGIQSVPHEVIVRMANFKTFTTKYTVSGSGTFDIAVPTALIRGRVVDGETGEALEGAYVDVTSPDVPNFWSDQIITSQGGTFLFDALTPGKYEIRASKSGYGQGMKSVTVGEAPLEIELELEKSEGATLSIVDGRDGHPVSTWASVKDASGTVVMNRNLEPRPDGTVRLPLSAGTYTVRLYAMYYAPTTATVSAPSTGTRIVLLPGGKLEITSSRSVRTLIRLLEGSGMPFEGSRFNDKGELPVDPGTVVLSNLSPGHYTLQVLDGANQVEKAMPVTISEGGVAKVSI